MGKNINPTHNLYGHISELMRFRRDFHLDVQNRLVMGCTKSYSVRKVMVPFEINRHKKVKYHNFMVVGETVVVDLLS